MQKWLSSQPRILVHLCEIDSDGALAACQSSPAPVGAITQHPLPSDSRKPSSRSLAADRNGATGCSLLVLPRLSLRGPSPPSARCQLLLRRRSHQKLARSRVLAASDLDLLGLARALQRGGQLRTFALSGFRDHYQPASVGPKPSQVQRGATQLDSSGSRCALQATVEHRLCCLG